MAGERPKKYKALDDLADLCMSFVYVDARDDRPPVPACEGNPLQFNCPACKCFKRHGCCPHVLCINHIMKAHNVRHLVTKLPKRKEKETRNLKGGPPGLKRPPKALERMEYPPTDSSDEELETEEAAELLALEGDSDEDEDEDM